MKTLGLESQAVKHRWIIDPSVMAQVAAKQIDTALNGNRRQQSVAARNLISMRAQDVELDLLGQSTADVQIEVVYSGEIMLGSTEECLGQLESQAEAATTSSEEIPAKSSATPPTEPKLPPASAIENAPPNTSIQNELGL